jgi:hypothetical protein
MEEEQKDKQLEGLNQQCYFETSSAKNRAVLQTQIKQSP